MYTRLINSSYRHPKIYHKCAQNFPLQHYYMYMQNVKIAHGVIFHVNPLPHTEKDKCWINAGPAPVQNRFVWYIKEGGVLRIMFSSFYVWWKNELLTAELRWLHLFITLTKIGIITVINKKCFISCFNQMKHINGFNQSHIKYWMNDFLITYFQFKKH